MKKLRLAVLAMLLILCLAACACKHEWMAANCTDPKTCINCNITEGESLGHNWIDSTCTTPKTCESCGITEGEPLGHTWEIIDGAMMCTVCDEVDESFVVDVGPLYGVPTKENQDAFEKYLDIFNQNNVQNDATFLEHNGWIYGQAWDNNGNSQFIKVRTDGCDWTVLDTGFAHNIYIVDNYIYYMINSNDTSGIYKMKTSGEDKQKISDLNGSMQVVD